MKLATLKDGTRDGQLMVVSRDLKTAQLADGVARTLQRALDDWTFIAPQLEAIYLDLNHGRGRRSFDFEPANCMAPLPRAFQWADGSAYVNHVELVRKARGAGMPASFWDDPLMYQGGSDDFLGPTDDIALLREAWGIDFEAEVAVVTDDVPMGATPDQAHQRIRLLMLAEWRKTATQKRQNQRQQNAGEEARENGDVPRSREVATFTVLMTAGAGLWMPGGGLSPSCRPPWCPACRSTASRSTNPTS
jgi:2-keto-4-pentenoate hydratase/2-oxohepta-3-ene-1,7-dioic acid hydratase in catechol pathway